MDMWILTKVTFSEVRERMVPSIKDAASLRLQCGKKLLLILPHTIHKEF